MKIIEIQGGGFHPGIPASIAAGNCRVKLDDAENVVEVVPLGQPFSDDEGAPSEIAEQPQSEVPREKRKASQS
jgi:hypothetical protein